MRKQEELDWEAWLTLAHAQRGGGMNQAAIKNYLEFAAKFPKNIYSDDANYWAAELLLTQGKKAQARSLYEKIAANPKSSHRAEATKRLVEH